MKQTLYRALKDVRKNDGGFYIWSYGGKAIVAIDVHLITWSALRWQYSYGCESEYPPLPLTHEHADRFYLSLNLIDLGTQLRHPLLGVSRIGQIVWNNLTHPLSYASP